MNDISNQMEEQEIESWKKLIRVINHEIMNSMTPIITLTLAIRKKLMKGEGNKTAVKHERADLKDAINSAGIIEERSRGLVSFINRYKKLTGLPPLNKSTILAKDLFLKIENLFGEELQEKGIRLIYEPECMHRIEADQEMLEQVLINLVKNAAEALEDCNNPEIKLLCYSDTDRNLCLTVSDNGEGIPADRLGQVFVPFYTTREEGSGIGLSLCRQIMRLHKGRINIESEQGKGTRVNLEFEIES